MVIEYTIPYKNKKIKCVDFNGFIDQYEYIKSFIKNNTFNTASDVDKKDDFYGKNDLQKTINGMSYGFREATNYFLDSISEIKNTNGLSDGMFMDIEGFAYDMGAVVNGEPECCINIGLPTPTPCITIMIDLPFSCMFTSKQIYNRGVAITNLINTLLLNGYIVDLYGMEYNTQSDMDTMYTIKIDTKTLSISNIAFLSSPEYFRKIGFITIDKIRNRESERGRGRSKTLDFMVKKIKKDKIFFIGGDFNDNEIGKNLNSIKDADNYILKIFNKYCDENKITIKFKEDK